MPKIILTIGADAKEIESALARMDSGLKKTEKSAGSASKAIKDSSKALKEQEKAAKDASDAFEDARDKVKDSSEALRDFVFSAAEGNVNVDALATAVDKLGGAFKGLGFAVAAIGIGLAFKAAYDEGSAAIKEFNDSLMEASNVNLLVGTQEQLDKSLAAAEKAKETAKNRTGYYTYFLSGGKTSQQYINEAEQAVNDISEAIRGAALRQRRIDFTRTLLGDAGDAGSANAQIFEVNNNTEKQKQAVIDKNPLARNGNVEGLTRQANFLEKQIEEQKKKVENARQGGSGAFAEPEEQHLAYLLVEKERVALARDGAAEIVQIEKEKQYSIDKILEEAYDRQAQIKLDNQRRNDARAISQNRELMQTMREESAQKDVDSAQKSTTGRFSASQSKAYADGLQAVNEVQTKILENNRTIAVEQEKIDGASLSTRSAEDEEKRQKRILSITKENAALMEKQRKSGGNKEEAARLQVQITANNDILDTLAEEAGVYDRIKKASDKINELLVQNNEHLLEARKYKVEYLDALAKEIALTKQLENARNDAYKKSVNDIASEKGTDGKRERRIKDYESRAASATTEEGFNYYKGRAEQEKSQRGVSQKTKEELSRLEAEKKIELALGNNDKASKIDSDINRVRDNSFNRYKTSDRESPTKVMQDQLTEQKEHTKQLKDLVNKFENINKTS